MAYTSDKEIQNLDAVGAPLDGTELVPIKKTGDTIATFTTVADIAEHAGGFLGLQEVTDTGNVTSNSMTINAESSAAEGLFINSFNFPTQLAASLTDDFGGTLRLSQDGTYGAILRNRALTSHVAQFLPNGSGTLALSVNGEVADDTGNIVLALNPWNLGGNTGTDENVDFIGTRDDQDFIVKTDDVEVARFTAEGKFGVGTSPNYKLDIVEDAAGVAAAYITNLNADGAGLAVSVHNSVVDRTAFSVLSGAIGTTSRFEVTADGKVKVPSLTNLVTQDKLVGVLNSTGQLGNITLGSGLSLGAGVLSATAGTITSGTYSPTVTKVTNCSGLMGVGVPRYTRNGNIVHVESYLIPTPDGAGPVQADVSLPIASNLGSTNDLSGHVTSDPTIGITFGRVEADTVNDRAKIKFNALNASGIIYYSFSYNVI